MNGGVIPTFIIISKQHDIIRTQTKSFDDAVVHVHDNDTWQQGRGSPQMRLY
jgi:hypothetical protein